uniref:Uncharacterized protein n=1 Tax=Guillardia theta TaxID=55529 RepID=A0A7S4NLX7_GUITH|mmetsp:Transcript_24649/g.80797  ORF Transcript_24649/g.80797 Transcript_24649/m.80797 type:complete len:354 (+) Transcript_24649:273-1334(+)
MYADGMTDGLNPPRVQEQTRDPSLYKLRRSVFYRTAALLPEEVDLRQLMSLDESRMSAKNLKKLLEQESRFFLLPLETHTFPQALQEGRNPVQAELVGIKRDLIKLENFTPLDGCRVQEEGKHSAKEKERALAEVDERLPSLPLNVETLMGDLDIAMEAAPRGKEEAIECLNLLHSFFTLKLQWNISDHHHSQILTRQNDAANEKLWEAASAGDMELLKEALKEGADVNAKRDSQLFCTSMHLAAAGGHTDVIAHLAESGAVIDMPNCLGSTPLHWAAACDREEACQTLLNLGSNARVINWHGLTPADRAKAAGSRRTSWLLRRAHGGGARWSISAGEPRDTPDMRLFEGNQG